MSSTLRPGTLGFQAKAWKSATGSVVAGVARSRAPHRLPKYARDVAADFHQFYSDCIILTDDRAQTVARLGLALATQTVLAKALELCGVSAPETM